VLRHKEKKNIHRHEAGPIKRTAGAPAPGKPRVQ
jgi:hypothetical protein